jgi:cytochrome P450 family 6
MHRNEEYFPDPLAYKPERWVEKVDGAWKLKSNNNLMASYMPWSTGVRSCQGQPYVPFFPADVTSS